MIPWPISGIGHQRLTEWVENTEVEGQHFEVKSALSLGKPKLNAELLKDLTAMGNGGGGTVVFGLTEKKYGEQSQVDAIAPLTDRQLISRAYDLINGSIRPTLVAEIETVEVDNGFVLIADIEPSPLGPYMVENLREFRYWVRVGDRTAEMPERLVHDAYERAIERRASRVHRWQNLALPIPSRWSGWPHLSLSALPETEGRHRLDPAAVDLEQIRAEGSEQAIDAGLAALTDTFTIWADGFLSLNQAEQNPEFKFRPDQAALRIHRGGAIGYSLHPGTSTEANLVRALNITLLYVGRVWNEFGVRSGSVRIEMGGLNFKASNLPPTPFPMPERTMGQPFADLRLDSEVRTTDLVSAPKRHRIIGEFANQLANVFGRRQATLGFSLGRLYQQGRRTELVAYEDRLHWTEVKHSQDLSISTNGAVRRAQDASPCAWWADGLLLDLNGDAVAALEFSGARGVPNDFVPGEIDHDDINENDFRFPGEPGPVQPDRPEPSGRWRPGLAEDFAKSA